MPILKGLRQESLLSQRRARGKKFPSTQTRKLRAESKWKMGLLTIWEGLSRDRIPYHLSLLAHEVVRQQATKDADIITIQTDVRPTYNLRRIYGTRGFGCGRLHSVGYEMVIWG